MNKAISNYMREQQKKSWDAQKKKYGANRMSELSRLGVEARKAKAAQKKSEASDEGNIHNG